LVPPVREGANAVPIRLAITSTQTGPSAKRPALPLSDRLSPNTTRPLNGADVARTGVASAGPAATAPHSITAAAAVIARPPMLTTVPALCST
jgi:hypothetical protein